MNWGFSLDGNLLHLKTILSKDKDDLNEMEENIRSSFDNEKELLEKLDAIISLANYTSDILCNEYGVERNKITTIYNGLQATNHLASEEKLKLKKKYRIAQKEKIILFAGRLDPVKGVDKLINAFKKVLEQRPESRLIIAGEGNYPKMFVSKLLIPVVSTEPSCSNYTVLPISELCRPLMNSAATPP
jgi:glycosyltransferase involved in cell wall biosynthesis